MNKILIISLLLSLIVYNCLAQDANETRIITTTSGGSSMSGSYSIWYSHNNSKILKPFLICEGFDPIGSVDAAYVRNSHIGQNFCDALRIKGYDVIVLNLNNNALAIEKNADLFIALINAINAELATNNSYHRLNVLGVSMGGLIIRYALAKMETQGLDHRVDNYISFDSPQLGANVPLGIQQMLYTYLGPLIDIAEWNAILEKLDSKGLRDKMEGLSMQILGANIHDLADFTAAFEMSACYMKENVLRSNYLTNLANVGSFPHKCRNIAISLGTNTVNQGYEAGTKLLGLNQTFTLVNETVTLPCNLGSYNFSWTPLSINNQVNAMKGDGNGLTFAASFQTQSGPNAPYNGLFYPNYYFQHDYLAPANDLRLDNAPGSYQKLPLSGLMDWLDTRVTIPIDLSKNVCIDIPLIGHFCETVGKKFDLSFPRSKIFGTLTTATGTTDDTEFRFCFVPTFSALAINNSDWFADIKQIIPTYPYSNDKSKTPFDAIYFSQNNYQHPFSPDQPEPLSVYNFLADELMPDNLYIQNRAFNNSYSNVFEAKTIVIGNNIDPAVNRTPTGDVTSMAGSKLAFRVPGTGSVTLKNGCSLNGDIRIFADASYSYSAYSPIVVSQASASLKSATVPPIKDNELRVLNVENYSETTITDDANVLKSAHVSNKVEQQILETKIEIRPNPIVEEGKVLLEISRPTKIIAIIISMQGVVVKNIIDGDYESGVYSVTFNTTDMPKGFYLCNIYYNGIFKTIKLIIQ